MGNMRSHGPDTSLTETNEIMQSVIEEMKLELDGIKNKYQSGRVHRVRMKTLMTCAVENCIKEAVVQWLRENSESEDFSKLVDMYDLLKKHIDEEEKKNHSNNIDVTIMAHGSITEPMIPASCLLPLPTITDVVLYSPWNCKIYSDAAYGVGTGEIKPQHRDFFCETKKSCRLPDRIHQPMKLPNHWNSMKEAGDQMIPTITLNPLKPPEDRYWKRFEFLIETHGPPGRNRIVIPLILPGQSSDSVPFSVVTLALSLVLLSSRFRATVHLAACLGDRSTGQRLDKHYLRKQYAYTVSDTGMTVSDDMLNVNLKVLKSG